MLLFDRLKSNRDAVAYKLRTRSKIVPALIVFVNTLCAIPFRLYNIVAKAKTKLFDPENILIIRADRIGDMILTTPIFKALKQRYPKANITCMASTLSGQLIDANPYIDSVMIYDPSWFDRKKGDKALRNYSKILRQIRAHKFDTAIDLRGNIFNFFFLMFLPRIPRRISFDAALGNFLLTDQVTFKPGKHETEYFFDIVKYMGGQTESDSQAELMLSAEEQEYAETFFREHNIADDQKIIAIHPGAGLNRIYKRWTEEGYSKIGKALVERYGAKIIITGSKPELELAQRIKGQIGENSILAAGKTCNLKHLAAVLKKCYLCIGTSTGTTHVAAAVGIPVVVLCGPEDPARWHPLGNNYILVEKYVPCRPCREEKCPYDGRCLRSISPEDVLQAVDLLLNKKTGNLAG